MSELIIPRDPDPFGPPVRKFYRSRHNPYPNLAKLRDAMVEDDRRLIEHIGSRMMEDYWLEPVTDSSMSARNNVGRMAEHARTGHVGFPRLVELVYGVLAHETSPVIDDIDQAIVTTIAARTGKAMIATVFKWDRGEGIAPTQQAKNQERAVEIAGDPLYAIHPDYGDLAAVVHDVYGILVPVTANVLQQAMFDETCIDDWDAGLAAAFKDLILEPH